MIFACSATEDFFRSRIDHLIDLRHPLAVLPYEFGVKVGVARTLRGNLILGARTFAGNPYDGHALNEQLEQAAILMQDSQTQPETLFVDLGYRSVDADNPGVRIVRRGKRKRTSEQERKQLRRHQAIEPVIGHLKNDHRMDRCHLKGEQGDRLHALLCAAGYNIKRLLRMIAKKRIGFLQTLCSRLYNSVAMAPNWPEMLRRLLDVAFSRLSALPALG